MSKEWWKDFFDADYVHLWGEWIGSERTDQEVEAIWQLLGLKKGSRVLDAACGYGRISHGLAARGAFVLGVDQSQCLIDRAECDRENLPQDELKYLCCDLRQPLDEEGFDAAIIIFSSLGYGTEEDDLSILKTLREAVRPEGLVFVETNRVVAQFRSGHRPIPVLFECYRIRTDSGMPRLGIRFSTSHLMMPSTR